MGQRMRVVGWLRFGSKAQLTKGLRGFAAHAPAEFYDESAWDVDGLDARVAIDVELPGDFTGVEQPFLAMIGSAAFGYVDYFEQGNDRISQLHGPGGPLKRWELASLRHSRLRWLTPSGSRALGYPGDATTMVLAGACEFADPKAAAAAIALPFRLPYLDAGGVRELRLGHDAWALDGARVTARATVTGPLAQLREPLLEALASIASRSTSGALRLRDASMCFEVGLKARIDRTTVRAPLTPEPGAVSLAPVDASEPIAAPVEASAAADEGGQTAGGKVADGKTAGRRKAAGRKAPAAATALPTEGGPVYGARLLSTGQLLTWGETSVTVRALPALTPLHTLSTKPPGQGGWMIKDALELPNGLVAIVHDGQGDFELIDPRKGEVRRFVEDRDSYGLDSVVCDRDRLVTRSIRGDVKIWSLDGEPLASLPRVEDHSYEPLAALGDGTVLVFSGEASRRVRVETGEVVETLGKQTAAHLLGDGRYLLENDGQFELRGGKKSVSFALDEGNSHLVRRLDDDHVVMVVRRCFHVVSLVDGSSREIRSGHSRDIGDMRSLGDDRWATHGKSRPGLNEQSGFDGTLKLWSAPSWTPLASYDARAPIREALLLAGDRLALFFDDALRGKEVDLVDARTARLVATLKGPKKAIVGQLVLPDGRLLVWAKDHTAHVLPTSAA